MQHLCRNSMSTSIIQNEQTPASGAQASPHACWRYKNLVHLSCNPPLALQIDRDVCKYSHCPRRACADSSISTNCWNNLLRLCVRCISPEQRQNCKRRCSRCCDAIPAERAPPERRPTDSFLSWHGYSNTSAVSFCLPFAGGTELLSESRFHAALRDWGGTAKALDWLAQRAWVFTCLGKISDV